jgi:hypothetical protein
MTVFLDFLFDPDCIDCTTGCAYVMPKGLSTKQNGKTVLTHDCCTMTELEHVLSTLEKDIAAIRKKAKAKFAKIHGQAPRSAFPAD